MGKFRNNMMQDGAALQGSMTTDPADYKNEKIVIPMKGVIIEVRPSDALPNRSAQRFSDRQGFIAECSVWVPDLNNVILPNVLITPDAPSGLDDYYERLPRGTTGLITGEDLPSSFASIDPSELDGDWCLVAFLGGSMQSPYILKWWPSPANRLDPATSGLAFPNPNTGEGNALEQAGRYFSRVNGVECVVSTEGNISISTRFANSKLDLSGKSATTGLGATSITSSDDAFKLSDTEGRPSRSSLEDGGSIKLQIKPSQSFEIDFFPAVDGRGWQDVNDPELPQTNPKSVGNNPPDRVAVSHSYLNFDTNQITIDVPVDFKVNSKNTITLGADTGATVTAPEIHLVASTEVVIGAATSEQYLALGTALVEYLQLPGIVASPMGPLGLINPFAMDPVAFPDDWESLLSDKHKVEER